MAQIRSGPLSTGVEPRVGSRIHHMDAVRCFCMLYGLLVHGSTIAERPLFMMIQVSSEYFRMVTFFLVSGFFSAMVAARRPTMDFFRHRGQLLLVPLFAGLILLNPITNWLTLWVHDYRMPFFEWLTGGWRIATDVLPLHANWHLHLWFLFCLFFYALLTPLLNRLFRMSVVSRFSGLLDKYPNFSPLLLATSIGITTVLLRTFHNLFIELSPGSHIFQYIIMVSFGYFPFFAIGALAFIERPVLESLHRLPLLFLTIFGVAYMAWPMVEPYLPWGVERAGHFFLQSAFMLMIVMTILHVARRYFWRGSKMLSMLTDSVYSFYMFHLLFIYAVAAIMHRFTDNPYIIYSVILVAGYPLLIALHLRVIAKSPFLMWLFNGKPWSRGAKPAVVRRREGGA